jgi:hypothetical protein
MVEKFRVWAALVLQSIGIVLTVVIGIKADLLTWLKGVEAWRFAFVVLLFLWGFWILYRLGLYLAKRFDEQVVILKSDLATSALSNLNAVISANEAQLAINRGAWAFQVREEIEKAIESMEKLETARNEHAARIAVEAAFEQRLKAIEDRLSSVEIT